MNNEFNGTQEKEARTGRYGRPGKRLFRGWFLTIVLLGGAALFCWGNRVPDTCRQFVASLLGRDLGETLFHDEYATTIPAREEHEPEKAEPGPTLESAPESDAFASSWLEETPFRIGMISDQDDADVALDTEPVSFRPGSCCVLDANGKLTCESGRKAGPLFTVSESAPSPRLTSSSLPYSETETLIPAELEAVLRQANAQCCHLEHWGQGQRHWRFSCEIQLPSGARLMRDAVATDVRSAVLAALENTPQ